LYSSLTTKAKDQEQTKPNSINENFFSVITQDSSDIFSLLVNAQEKFQESVCCFIYLKI
jgi:hypothetical protein